MRGSERKEESELSGRALCNGESAEGTHIMIWQSLFSSTRSFRSRSSLSSWMSPMLNGPPCLEAVLVHRPKERRMGGFRILKGRVDVAHDVAGRLASRMTMASHLPSCRGVRDMALGGLTERL